MIHKLTLTLPLLSLVTADAGFNMGGISGYGAALELGKLVTVKAMNATVNWDKARKEKELAANSTAQGLGPDAVTLNGKGNETETAKNETIAPKIVEKEVLLMRSQVRNATELVGNFVELSDMIGIPVVRQSVMDRMVNPYLVLEYAASLGLQVSIPHGIIFWGPSGTGKKNAVYASVKAAGIKYIEPDTLYGSMAGESEKLVQALFKVALENQPCAIIIDKVEIKLKREGGTKSAVDQFLISWDELIRSEANVTVIATATDLSELDGALSRRFEEKYRLEPLQTTEERASLYRLFLRASPLDVDITHSDLLHIASITKKLSGSQVRDVVTIACGASSSVLIAALANDTVTDAEIEALSTKNSVDIGDLETAAKQILKGVEDMERSEL